MFYEMQFYKEIFVLQNISGNYIHGQLFISISENANKVISSYFFAIS
jgi:hypothetical protein